MEQGHWWAIYHSEYREAMFRYQNKWYLQTTSRPMREWIWSGLTQRLKGERQQRPSRKLNSSTFSIQTVLGDHLRRRPLERDENTRQPSVAALYMSKVHIAFPSLCRFMSLFRYVGRFPVRQCYRGMAKSTQRSRTAETKTPRDYSHQVEWLRHVAHCQVKYLRVFGRCATPEPTGHL